MRPFIIAPSRHDFKKVVENLGLSVIGPDAAYELNSSTQLEGVAQGSVTILVYEMGAMRTDPGRMNALKRARDRGMQIFMLARMPA